MLEILQQANELASLAGVHSKGEETSEGKLLVVPRLGLKGVEECQAENTAHLMSSQHHFTLSASVQVLWEL